MMTDYLGTLPVELLHTIFNDLSMGDILSSMCFVNKRLRVICLAYPRFHFDFTLSAKKKEQFELVCSHLPHIASQILTLTFSDRYNSIMNLKITHFFSRFNTINDTFSRLHSITLCPIDFSTWCSINNRLISLVSLVSLSIVSSDINNLIAASAVSKLLRELLYNSRALKRLSVKVWISGTGIFIVDPCSEANRSSLIENLTLEGIRVELKSLLKVTPALQTLDTTLKLFQFQPDTRLHPPDTMRNLTIKVNFVTLETIDYMLYSMTQLIHFTIISDNVQYDMADGITWSRLLKTVVTFKFQFTFDRSTFTQPLIDLASFRTPFWLEEKHWYVTYDRCIDTGFSLLYSNPYCLDVYPLLYMKDFITTVSTKPTSTSMPFPYTDSLIIDYCQPAVMKLLRSSSPITRLWLADCGNNLRTMLDYAITHIELSQVTLFSAFQCELDMSNDVFAKFVHSLPRLRSLHLSVVLLKLLFVYQWPHIIHLRLSTNISDCSEPLTLCEIGAFCRSFTHVERLCISINTFSDLSRFLSNMITKKLSEISIVQDVNGSTANNDQIIQRDWIEKNTQLRNFHYLCDKNNTIDLWL